MSVAGGGCNDADQHAGDHHGYRLETLSPAEQEYDCGCRTGANQRHQRPVAVQKSGAKQGCRNDGELGAGRDTERRGIGNGVAQDLL